jgi:hypothetical protein
VRMDAVTSCPVCGGALEVASRERRRDFGRCLPALNIDGGLRGLVVCSGCDLHVLYMAGGDVHLLPADVILAVVHGAPRGVVHVDVRADGVVKVQPVRDCSEN